MLILRLCLAILTASLVIGCSSASVAKSTVTPTAIPTARSILDGEPEVQSITSAKAEGEIVNTNPVLPTSTFISTLAPMQAPTPSPPAGPTPTATALAAPSPDNNPGTGASTSVIQEATPAFIPPQTRVHAAGPESSGTASLSGHVGTVTIDFGTKAGDPDVDIQARPLPDKEPLKYPTLGSNLNRLVVSVEEGRATAEEAAADAAIHQGESVAVTIHLSGNVDDVVQFLSDNGGDPRNMGEDYIEAYVPVPLLGPVSEQTGVIRVREIVPPQPAGPSQVGGPTHP